MILKCASTILVASMTTRSQNTSKTNRKVRFYLQLWAWCQWIYLYFISLSNASDYFWLAFALSIATANISTQSMQYYTQCTYHFVQKTLAKPPKNKQIYRVEFHGSSGSYMKVTGPSFVKETSIIAPKIPLLTRSGMYASYSFLKKSS